MRRVEDLEIRYSEGKLELVQWSECKTGCFTIALFDTDSGECDIRFIGDRPFKADKDDLVWAMLRYGQAIVEAELLLEEEVELGGYSYND